MSSPASSSSSNNHDINTTSSKHTEQPSAGKTTSTATFQLAGRAGRSRGVAAPSRSRRTIADPLPSAAATTTTTLLSSVRNNSNKNNNKTKKLIQRRSLSSSSKNKNLPLPSCFVDSDVLAALEADFFAQHACKSSQNNNNKSIISSNNNNKTKNCPNKNETETTTQSQPIPVRRALVRPENGHNNNNQQQQLPNNASLCHATTAKTTTTTTTSGGSTALDEEVLERGDNQYENDDDDNNNVDDDLLFQPVFRTSSVVVVTKPSATATVINNNNSNKALRPGLRSPMPQHDNINNHSNKRVATSTRTSRIDSTTTEQHANRNGRNGKTGALADAGGSDHGGDNSTLRSSLGKTKPFAETATTDPQTLPQQHCQDGPTTTTTAAPPLSVLHAAVDAIFAAIPPERLSTCSVGEFVQWTQQQCGTGTAAFTKETKRCVKQRVAFLLQRQQRHNNNNNGLPISTVLRPATHTLAEKQQQQQQQQQQHMEDEPNALKDPLKISTAPLPVFNKEQQQQEQLLRDGSVRKLNSSSKASPPGSTLGLSAKRSKAQTGGKGHDEANKVAASGRDDSEIIQIDEPEAGKPPPKKKAATRRPRAAKAASTAATLHEPSSEKNMAASECASPAPAVRQRARCTKSCTLCARCPCTRRDSSAGLTTTTTDFAQSDAAIEKALMKRLLHLEETADLYDEQTDAVRRRLKQHRRDIWKKRQALLQRYDERQAKRARNNGTTTVLPRFLPDVDECLPFDQPHQRRTTGMVGQAQRAVFATTTQKPATVQPTLTQMLGGGMEEEDTVVELHVAEKEEENAAAFLENVASERADGLYGNNGGGDDDDIANNESCVNYDGYPQLGEIASPAVRVETFSSSESDSPAKNAGRSSIWDAVRNGNYTSSWDRLFYEEEYDDLGVDHLLGLLGSTQDMNDNMASPAHRSQQNIPDFSPSSLTTRGKTLADAVKGHVFVHEAKRFAIERVCPNWQENVEFAMSRKVGTDVSEALQNVRKAKARLQRNKLEILKKIEQQEAALEIFEESLEQSLTRFSTCALTSSSPPPSAGHPREIDIPECPTGWARESSKSEACTILSKPFSSPTGSSGFACSTKDRTSADKGADRFPCPPGAPDTPLSVASIAIASQ